MSDPDPLIGTMLGPCRIEMLVGRGGMGRVYMARHLALDRRVAVKIVDEGDSGLLDAGTQRAQVLDEARTAAKFEDPRIVAIYDVGEERGIPYIVMQWVAGESLEARVKRCGPLPPAEALAIVKEMAGALAAAHAAGLVHRDVKPGNILIDARGAVKLADFGIACSTGTGAAQGEVVVGSFHFMAPEQASGGVSHPSSDLYALGSTWYYALTAHLPYPGSSLDAFIRHRDESPPEVRLLRPEVTEKAASLLRRLMAKKIEDRPADAKTLLLELSSAGMLLDTDASGSPFKILPSVPRQDQIPRAVPLSVPLFVAPVEPPSFPLFPPQPNARTLGSRYSFLGLLAAFGLLAFGWQWRKASFEDWAAGAVVFAVLPAILTVGLRWTVQRKVLAVLSVVAAAFCWGRFALGGAAKIPSLEAGILAGLGGCALFGSVYLGQWGQERSEAVWARVLAPIAGIGLLLSALTWSAPENQPWSAAVASRGADWWLAFSASGGVWRWLGTLGVGVAMGAADRLKIPDASEPKDRKLNWNR